MPTIAGDQASALTEAHHLWQQTLDQLRFQMTRPTFDTWLRQTEVLSWEEDKLVIKVQSEAAQAWLENRLKETIERALSSVVGEICSVHFEV